MDERRFDRVARLVGTRSTRRALVRLMVGTPLAGALAASSGASIAARRHKRKCRRCGLCERCKRGKCRPQPDGVSCGGGRLCQDAACICPTEKTICGNDCADLLTDAGHCGTCDNACPAGESCNHGTCTCDPFANSCPLDLSQPPERCGCSGGVAGGGTACTDRNSACDLDKPCDSNDDCPPRSICLLRCRDAGDPLGPGRCSTPCN